MSACKWLCYLDSGMVIHLYPVQPKLLNNGSHPFSQDCFMKVSESEVHCCGWLGQGPWSQILFFLIFYERKCQQLQGLFQQFWEKAPGQNWEKKIDLTSKLGEINDIEHYKGSKIYPQNEVILDCIMPSIPLKH